MEKTLLTKVVTQLVNERANAQEYGVALVNIPDFDYVAFALGLSCLLYTSDAADD